MRGERRVGRFTIDHERSSIVHGTSQELVRTVGQELEWWFYDSENTVVDDIYDVGGSVETIGGRRWVGPIKVPAVSISLFQGVTVPTDRGFYNTDVLRITLNMDVINTNNFMSGDTLLGSNAATIPQLSKLETNADHYLRDRIVFRGEVFSPKQIMPKGLLVDNFTLVTIECNQVNPEELINDLQFKDFADYSPFN